MGIVNYKKKQIEGRCDAQRCTKEEPLTIVEDKGKTRQLCERHLTKLNKTDDEDPTTLDPTTGAAAIQEAIAPIHTEAQSTLARLPQVIIQNQQMLEIAGQILQKTKGDAKRLDDQRKTATKPMLDAKRTIDGWFKPAFDTLKQIESGLKSAISAYVDKARDEQVAALQSGDHQAGLATVAPELPGGVSTRTLWKFEITDPLQVPSNYWVIDPARIQAVVSELKDKADIPGVRVYPETGIASSST